MVTLNSCVRKADQKEDPANPNIVFFIADDMYPEMFNDSASKPEIFTKTGNEQLVINSMNEIPFDTEISIGFVTGQAADFSISRTEMSNFEPRIRILLKDKLNPVTKFELSEGASYHFSTQQTTASTDRFNLIFCAPSATTGLNVTEKLIAQIFVNTANQIVVVATEKTRIWIYNSIGQKLFDNSSNILNSTLNIHHKNELFKI